MLRVYDVILSLLYKLWCSDKYSIHPTKCYHTCVAAVPLNVLTLWQWLDCHVKHRHTGLKLNIQRIARGLQSHESKTVENLILFSKFISERKWWKKALSKGWLCLFESIANQTITRPEWWIESSEIHCAFIFFFIPGLCSRIWLIRCSDSSSISKSNQVYIKALILI